MPAAVMARWTTRVAISCGAIPASQSEAQTNFEGAFWRTSGTKSDEVKGVAASVPRWDRLLVAEPTLPRFLRATDQAVGSSRQSGGRTDAGGDPYPRPPGGSRRGIAYARTSTLRLIARRRSGTRADRS